MNNRKNNYTSREKANPMHRIHNFKISYSNSKPHYKTLEFCTISTRSFTCVHFCSLLTFYICAYCVEFMWLNNFIHSKSNNTIATTTTAAVSSSNTLHPIIISNSINSQYSILTQQKWCTLQLH